MIFDAIAMVWRGNDDTLDIFHDIEETEEKHGMGFSFFLSFFLSFCFSLQNVFAAFSVGFEFSLSPEQVNNFKRCEEDHHNGINEYIISRLIVVFISFSFSFFFFLFIQ
jgi:hypothetical protein